MPRSKGARAACLMFCFILFALPCRATAEETADGIPVLIYHEVPETSGEPGETVIRLADFKAQMRYLFDSGYTTISMDELVGFMKGEGAAPKKPIVLTFDDGWKSQLNAVPILDQFHFKASFWIFPGKGTGEPYFNWDDVAAISRNPNFQIGSHSMTHPWDRTSNLVTWSNGKVDGRGAGDVEYELKESQRILEQKLDRKVAYFAWPCGWYTDAMVEMARSAGYEALLTAEAGSNRRGGDIFRIRRIFVDGACGLEVFKQTLRDHQYQVCQAKGRPTLGHLPQD